MENNNTGRRLWNKDFFLLWQGCLVSALGSIAYSIALGFWVYEKTGSTGLMGLLMAASSIPAVVLGPLAGVWVDRLDRKWILVATDLIRGFAICLVTWAMFAGTAEIWMVFAAGIVTSFCNAFFHPSVGSVIPDLIDSKDLEKGNSAFAMIGAGAQIAGSAGGSVMFKLLGAPVMFLINGVSYIFSAITELFITVPKVKKISENHFMADFKEGLLFSWNLKGLRILILSFAFINFFANIAIALLIPYFDVTPSLGTIKYGIIMAALSAGSMGGMVVLGKMKVTAQNRYNIFWISALAMALFFAVFPFFDRVFPVMVVAVVLAGAFNAVMNILINTIVQRVVPQEKRGKVFSIMGTVSGGLTPIAMALGGGLGEFFSYKYVIVISLSVLFVLMLFICQNRDIIDMLKQDYEETVAEAEAS